MIESLAATIHQLVGLRTERDFDAALALLDETYKRLVGLDGDLLRGASQEALPDLLSFAGELDAARAVAAAELLKEEGDIRAEMGRDDLAFNCYDRSVLLYLALLDRHGPMLLEGRLDRADAAAAALGTYEMPAEAGRRLFSYYRHTHRYADAETWLLRTLAASGDDRALLAEGTAFFEGLLRRTDRELSAGGTTREDAEDTLAELRGRLAG